MKERGTITEYMSEIAKNTRTQDNRITDQPMFAVQEEYREYGIDPDYSNDGYMWVNSDGEEPDERTEKRLDALVCGFRDIDKYGYRRVYYRIRWEFVMACFTEAGCKEHIRINGHNLCKPRIYAYGSYRNPEYQAIRNFLINNA